MLSERQLEIVTSTFEYAGSFLGVLSILLIVLLLCGAIDEEAVQQIWLGVAGPPLTIAYAAMAIILLFVAARGSIRFLNKIL